MLLLVLVGGPARGQEGFFFIVRLPHLAQQPRVVVVVAVVMVLVFLAVVYYAIAYIC